jgi:hypothetical protein
MQISKIVRSSLSILALAFVLGACEKKTETNSGNKPNANNNNNGKKPGDATLAPGEDRVEQPRVNLIGNWEGEDGILSGDGQSYPGCLSTLKLDRQGDLLNFDFKGQCSGAEFADLVLDFDVVGDELHLQGEKVGMLTSQALAFSIPGALNFRMSLQGAAAAVSLDATDPEIGLITFQGNYLQR